MDKKNIATILAAILIVIVLLSATFLSKDLNLDSKEVTDLYKYLGEVDINRCGGLITYSDKDITIKELSEENRLCMAYYQIEDSKKSKESIKSTGKNKNDIKICKVGENTTIATDDDKNECTYQTIKESDLKETYKKIYGKSLDNDKNFYISSTESCQKEGEIYYCGTAETYNYSIAPETTIYRLLNQAIKKHNGEIVIYDYFLKISGDTCYSKNNNEENKECSDSLSNNKEIDSEFVKKYGTIYKHTFKKDSNDNYYWYKSKLK